MNRLQEAADSLKGAVEELGYGLYHMEYVREAGENYLRFYIMREEGITLEDCETVSRRLSEILDQLDPIEDEYFLEVQSPGVFRPLFTLEHEKAALGEQVLVRTHKPVEGKKKLKGILHGVEPDAVEIAMEGRVFTVQRENLRSINIEVDF